METHKRFGLHIVISLVIFLILTKSLSSTVFDGSEYEEWESNQKEADVNHIANSILSYVYVLHYYISQVLLDLKFQNPYACLF